LATFFCNRTTLVHFFSSKPSYFFRVASSNSLPIRASRRSVAALSWQLMDVKYAMMAL
jgi:hypothetical protein